MTRSIKAAGMSLLTLLLVVSAVSARELSLDERVTAQKAIEAVYWNHRIWPKENPGPKPQLAAVMSDQAIRAKVDDYLKKSNALERFWQRPVTAEQLQAELDRMARNTRDGSTLQELFGALGNDPFVIAETLGRQTLVERLIRNWYANDARFHGELRKTAEASLAACTNVECMKAMGGEYREATWKLRAEHAFDAANPERDEAVRLDADAWTDHVGRLAKRLGATADAIPTGRLSRLEETREAFVVTAVLSQREGEVTTASVAWRKWTFDAWWIGARTGTGLSTDSLPNRFVVPLVPATTCSDDTWSPTSTLRLDERSDHSAVWTGSEMIVWGGRNDMFLATGGRYNPTTDTWTATSVGANVPEPRSDPTAVWTGTQMIVWGGAGVGVGSPGINTGGRYDPAIDSWTPTSTGANVPSGRKGHTAIWTGSQMIVWGGADAVSLSNTGGRYSPASDTWNETSTNSPVPGARESHSAVWTGTQMIVWGGGTSNTGGRYNPSTDSWQATSTGANVPAGRYSHTVVWTGTEMIVWGGGSSLATGGRYNPATDTWTATSTGANVPAGRTDHTAVWTGSQMVVWGGRSFNVTQNSGGRYSPGTDTWLATTTAGSAPVGRYGHTAVWTGLEMIAWGGRDGATYLNSGGRYSPTADSWVPTSRQFDPTERTDHTAVWTGTEMIVWGGTTNPNLFNTGGRYRPATDTWDETSTGANVPLARKQHIAVWTGTEMIVWGGDDGLYLNSGGRYSPSTDAWTATEAATNVPATRTWHTAVWTGTEMIVWGGYNGNYLNTGGRYRPSTNSWVATSTDPAVPPARWQHTAVWTGAEMIVWGGFSGLHLQTGGRYNPSTDAWTRTSGANVPAGRNLHTAVWTGTEMIVWGGFGGSYSNTGGRYDPSTESWTSTSTGPNVPAARDEHKAVWTGVEMIVWGGHAVGSLNTGGRYAPTTNSWTVTSTGSNVPAARSGHTAVWGDSKMVVWGGGSNGVEFDSGASYCACLGISGYRDADGDGHGNPGESILACAGSIPSGYVADSTDCNDGTAQIYAGAPEVNDGIDNQCPGDPGYGSIDEISGVSGFFSSSDDTLFSWPSQTGATSYEIARSPYGDFHAGCVHNTTAATSWSDPAIPPTGTAYYYLVRALAPRIGSWGKQKPTADRFVCPGCVSTGDWCDDGSLCTVGDVCTGTVCGGAPLSCDDANPCTDDSCNPASGCVHANNTSACDDGNICTLGDICQGGVCTGTVPGASHLVISQIQTSGDGGTPSSDEFIEIYNPTSSPVSLNGWSLQSVVSTFPSLSVARHNIVTGTIPAHGWFLVARPEYNGAVTKDSSNFIFTLPAAGNSVLLVNSPSDVTSCNSGSIVDKVAYGTGSCSEGATVNAPSSNNSILRLPGGTCGNGTDTNSNSADFVNQSPSTPRNSTSTPQP